MTNTTNGKATEIEIEYTAEFFTNHGRERLTVLVDISDNPRVRVWDSVGKLFTVCHRLTPAQEKRIVAKARKLAA